MKRILLIDDDPIFVLLFRKILETIEGERAIDVCGDGEAGIGHIIEQIKDNGELLPDVIFLDLNMPVLDGWGFLEAYSTLRDRLQKRIELYILSSTISADDVTRGMGYSFIEDFIIKPLERSKAEEILLHP